MWFGFSFQKILKNLYVSWKIWLVETITYWKAADWLVEFHKNDWINFLACTGHDQICRNSLHDNADQNFINIRLHQPLYGASISKDVHKHYIIAVSRFVQRPTGTKRPTVQKPSTLGRSKYPSQLMHYAIDAYHYITCIWLSQ